MSLYCINSHIEIQIRLNTIFDKSKALHKQTSFSNDRNNSSNHSKALESGQIQKK